MAYVPVATVGLVIWVDEDSLPAQARSILSAHIAAVNRVLEGRDFEAARLFKGISIADHQLVSDPDDIEELAAAGELDFDQFYTDIPHS